MPGYASTPTCCAVDFHFENLEIASHRAVDWTLSRDLDQARPLNFIQIPLQRDLLNDPLDLLANQLAVNLFRDDQPLVVRTDGHAINWPALAPA